MPSPRGTTRLRHPSLGLTVDEVVGRCTHSSTTTYTERYVHILCRHEYRKEKKIMYGAMMLFYISLILTNTKSDENYPFHLPEYHQTYPLLLLLSPVRFDSIGYHIMCIQILHHISNLWFFVTYVLHFFCKDCRVILSHDCVPS